LSSPTFVFEAHLAAEAGAAATTAVMTTEETGVDPRPDGGNGFFGEDFLPPREPPAPMAPVPPPRFLAAVGDSDDAAFFRFLVDLVFVFGDAGSDT
jgi:hypothetical protein